MRTYPTQHWRGWWWSEVIFWRSPHFKLGVNSQMKRGEKRGIQEERVTGRGEDIYKGLDLLMLFPKNSVALSYSGIGKILLTFISFLGKLLTCSWICSRKFLRGKIYFLKSPVCHRNWCLPWRKLESQWMRTLAKALEWAHSPQPKAEQIHVKY